MYNAIKIISLLRKYIIIYKYMNNNIKLLFGNSCDDCIMLNNKYVKIFIFSSFFFCTISITYILFI